MKKTLIIILALLGIFVFFICYKQNSFVARVGVDAEIIEISNDKTIIVLYKDEHNNVDLKFKVDCNIAIKKHQIFYCDYQTQMVQELSFDSLCVSDKIILSIDNTEFLQLQNDDIVQALQIQLATQRLHIEKTKESPHRVHLRDLNGKLSENFPIFCS